MRNRSFKITSCMSILIGLLFIVSYASAASTKQIKRYKVSISDSPVIGPEKAEITLIEFIDYQ